MISVDDRADSWHDEDDRRGQYGNSLSGLLITQLLNQLIALVTKIKIIITTKIKIIITKNEFFLIIMFSDRAYNTFDITRLFADEFVFKMSLLTSQLNYLLSIFVLWPDSCVIENNVSNVGFYFENLFKHVHQCESSHDQRCIHDIVNCNNVLAMNCGWGLHSKHCRCMMEHHDVQSSFRIEGVC